MLRESLLCQYGSSATNSTILRSDVVTWISWKTRYSLSLKISTCSSLRYNLQNIETRTNANFLFDNDISPSTIPDNMILTLILWHRRSYTGDPQTHFFFLLFDFPEEEAHRKKKKQISLMESISSVDAERVRRESYTHDRSRLWRRVNLDYLSRYDNLFLYLLIGSTSAKLCKSSYIHYEKKKTRVRTTSRVDQNVISSMILTSRSSN